MMRFDELDQQMRVFETANDQNVLPGIQIVARVDGRSFTRLTKEVLDLERPFDARFRDWMTATTAHLMDCGFKIVYGYHQSDEISLLVHPNEDSFGRKTRKYISILAGEASACFSLLTGQTAAFDCRISQLPNIERVIDYFRWRSEDAHRNALNGHCYWTLRAEGLSGHKADSALRGLSVPAKNELLFQRGLNFNDTPTWQRRGVGVWWKTVERTAVNRHTGLETTVTRRRLHTETDLPMRDEYSALVAGLISGVMGEK